MYHESGLYTVTCVLYAKFSEAIQHTLIVIH